MTHRGLWFDLRGHRTRPAKAIGKVRRSTTEAGGFILGAFVSEAHSGAQIAPTGPGMALADLTLNSLDVSLEPRRRHQDLSGGLHLLAQGLWVPAPEG